MERIINALKELHEINTAYSLPVEPIDKLLLEVDTARVCTPIIGKFSSGKSALLNTLLGYSRKILKEDITPETAVPTEIVYSSDEDRVWIVKNDGGQEQISVEDFRQLEVDANTVYCTRLSLKNHFLEEIPEVMLVDMPGFESGYEVHNRAIDAYLPLSLAYIIAVPADDMIIRSSVGNILKELCLHDMPLCVVITKYDKRNDDFEDTFLAMKESLKRFIGDHKVTYCITSSYIGDADELKEFLRRIQESSQEILARKFRTSVLSVADGTEKYLTATLKGSEMSESELDEQEERLGKQMDALNTRFSKEKKDFDLQISDCVEEIKSDIQIALEKEEPSLVAMAMNNQNLNERINLVVRNAVTVSIKKRFIPKVDRYLKRVENCINSETIGDVQVCFYFNSEAAGKGMVSATAAAVGAILGGGPVIGGIIAGVILLVAKIKGDKKREEMKSQIRTKLHSEVYPQVLREVGQGIQIAIEKQLQMINTSIEDEIKAQRDALEKALEDIREKMADEKEKRENLGIDIRADLERIQVIRSSIGLAP